MPQVEVSVRPVEVSLRPVEVSVPPSAVSVPSVWWLVKLGKRKGNNHNAI